ncbi:MAG: prepilin-type N-terminal cleavage/methylation domain-containing protein [Oscillospiraceae bacterium]
MLRRIKRLLRKRNNAGFTLIEVIIASALLGILMLGVFGFVQPVMASVKAKEQNARAVMLCETIESYIANSTKLAYYVQTFSGVTAADITTATTAPAPIVSEKYTGTEFPDQADASLSEMFSCMNSVLNTTNYEIRCIGMRWRTDPKTGEKKMMLTNEVVDQNTGALDPAKSKLVFETCFYDGLYPVLEYKNYSNQYQVLDDAGVLVDKYPAADVKMAPALEITMSIYLTPECYSTSETTRKEAMATFNGTTFADFRNIASTATINKAGEYKLRPNVEVHSYTEALTASAAEVYSDSKYGDCYYPETFIYYLTRKTTDISTPATP